ncbi:MAG: hypothetical protein GF329_14780 [Candidatus Lokiarchaeota archaeon]|nr:hypothetical protein [Candidatus Lokiarchaeota archaeon]
MSDKVEFAKIEKESLINGKEQRQLIEIPLLLIKNISQAKNKEKIKENVIKYYDQVKQWIMEFQKKVREISIIYFASYTEKDDIDEFLDENLDFHKEFKAFIKHLLKKVELKVVEDYDLFLEFIGWLETISMPGATEMDIKFFKDVSNERLEHISKHINESLKENQVGLLFINLNSGIIYPEELKVIHFKPPIVDEVKRLFENIFED